MHALSYVLAGAAALSLVQCGAERSRPPDTTSTRMWIEAEPEEEEMTPAALIDPAQPGALTARPPVESLSDAQIMAVMSSTHEAELQQARLALRKSRHAQVRKFAQMIISDHGSVQKKERRLVQSSGIAPSGSNLLSQLNTNTQAAAQMLQTADATEFDRAYMSVQVSSHEQVLAALDNELIPAAQNSELEALLEEIRPIVEHHLQQAQQIQQSLWNQ
jgi:putative membrane protein